MASGDELVLGEMACLTHRPRNATVVAVARPDNPRLDLSAEAVSDWWGVGRRWVYDHADELGARRLGTGKRPRLRFDPDEVAELLGVPDDRGGRDAR